MKKIAWLLVVILAMSMVFVACGGDSKEPIKDDKVTTDDKAGTEVKTETPATTADWVKSGNFSYKLVEAKVDKAVTLGGMEMSEEPGNVFVHVKYEVRNDSSEEIEYNSVLAAGKLFTADGKSFDNDLFADGVINEKIAPGSTIEGQFFFKVPGDMSLSISGSKLEINSNDILSTDKASIVIP